MFMCALVLQAFECCVHIYMYACGGCCDMKFNVCLKCGYLLLVLIFVGACPSSRGRSYPGISQKDLVHDSN